MYYFDNDGNIHDIDLPLIRDAVLFFLAIIIIMFTIFIWG